MIYLLGSIWLTLSIVGRSTATLSLHACGWLLKLVGLRQSRTGASNQPERLSDISRWSQRSGDHRNTSENDLAPWGRVPEKGGTPSECGRTILRPAVFASLRPPATIVLTLRVEESILTCHSQLFVEPADSQGANCP